MTRPGRPGASEPLLGGVLGGSPDQPDGAPPTPDCCVVDPSLLPDRGSAESGGYMVTFGGGGVPTIVQTKYAGAVGNVTLDTPATPGNTLIMLVARRDSGEPSDPLLGGFTAVGKANHTTDFQRSCGMWYRVVTADETGVTHLGDGVTYQSDSGNRTFLVEIVGAYASVGADQDGGASSTTMDCGGLVTPPAGEPSLIIGVGSIGGNGGAVTEGTDSVAWVDELTAGFSPYVWMGYRPVANPSGAYTVGGTQSTSVFSGVTGVFSGSEAAWSVPIPAAHDDDDSTYETVTGTDLARVDLGAAFRIVRTRIRIAGTNAGARTFTIKGANAADFSDEVTLTTIDWTATGSLTAQNVTAEWYTEDSYRYYELSVDDSDTYRLHAWELYEPTLAQNHQHDASGIAYDNGSSGLIADDIQEAIDELAATSGGLPWFDVTAYGATGDGTTNDTSDINDAIAALNANGGGVLYFPYGVYLINAALTTITVACIVRGDGAAAYPYATGTGSRIEQTSDTASVFTFTDPGWVVEDLAIINTEGAPTAGAGIVTSSTDALYARMSRIIVGGFYDCIDLDGNHRWSLTDSYIYDPVRYGVRIRGADDGDMSISGCYFLSDTHDGTAAIRQEGAGGLKVVNTKINERGVSGGEFVDGISVSIGAGIATSVLLLANSSIENVTGDAIDIATVSTGIFGQIAITNVQVGLYGNNSGRAVKIAAATNGSYGANGTIGAVVIDDLVARTDGTARAAVELTNTDHVTLGTMELVGFNARYTSSGDTNTTDGGGVTDHGALTGLSDDDHTQYVLRSILTTRGDLFRRGAAAIERVALGTSGTRLRSDGTDPVWSALRWEPMVTYDGLVMLDSAGNPHMHEVSD